MINRYSSRREFLSDSLLNKKLKDAKSYDRIAGYFSSSILAIVKLAKYERMVTKWQTTNINLN
jgi:hypothetical protein